MYSHTLREARYLIRHLKTHNVDNANHATTNFVRFIIWSDTKLIKYTLDTHMTPKIKQDEYAIDVWNWHYFGHLWHIPWVSMPQMRGPPFFSSFFFSSFLLSCPSVSSRSSFFHSYSYRYLPPFFYRQGDFINCSLPPVPYLFFVFSLCWAHWKKTCLYVFLPGISEVIAQYFHYLSGIW